MWQFALPALKAVGINAGVNLLRRKPLFENAGTAAVTGATFGGSDSLLGQTDFGKGLFNSMPSSIANVPVQEGTIESVMGPATASGTYLDKDYFANILGSPVYTGNEGLLSQIGTGAGSLFDMAQTELGDSITPQNLIGVSSILSNMANAPRPVANMGGGQITGTPPKFEPFQTGQVYTRKRGNR
jgi:hypothetical protein